MLRSLFAAATICLASTATPILQAEDYEIGGELAGLRLPLYPARHGAPAGHPGCIPDLKFATEDQAPEVHLYPDAVEHFRAYWFKYCPVRSFYDRQSQLRNWWAGELAKLAGVKAERYAEPVYWVPRHAPVRFTERYNPEVDVVRWTVDGPATTLDLGELTPGMYVLRVIAAVPMDHLQTVRKALFMTMTVNDQPDGGTSQSLVRVGYCDEFYSTAELFFHAPAKRPYRATLQVAEGSEVPLLVANVSLDDCLAGAVRRNVKTRRTYGSPVEVKKASQLASADRLARDAAVWNELPPLNTQMGGANFSQAAPFLTLPGEITLGINGTPQKDVDEAYGAWKPGKGEQFLVNAKLNLIYTLDDLKARRPLPDPYPYKDRGLGIVTLNPGAAGKGEILMPIANGVWDRVRSYPSYWADHTLDRGDEDALRDAAVAVVRWAYDFPARDAALSLAAIVRDPGPYGRNWSDRRRITAAFYLPHYAQYVSVLEGYDRLYDYLKNNQAVADSVNRFVPWVKTPQDVTRLIDTHWLQITAKRIMRYNYFTGPTAIADVAAIAGNAEVTDPWMQWLFNRTYIYPLPLSGIQDVMITGSGREGQQYIASSYYAMGEGADRAAVSVQRYIDAGGSKQYDLSDFNQFPKPVAHVKWFLRQVIGGADFPRIGDVSGPDKLPGRMLDGEPEFAYRGWRWTRDPRFAWVLLHHPQTKRESVDGNWSDVEAAAAKVARAPWLDNRSRVMPEWASVLETGLQHDDYRFRRAAYVRVGFGYGHHHDDVMDLQVVAHGLPMTIDDGQRPAYSSPAARSTLVHNTVEVDGQSYLDHSWARVLSDHEGARYTRVEAAGPRGVDLFTRQVALLDVDEGDGSQPLPPAQQFPRTKRPAAIRSANSYVLDVFRVAGGKSHVYGFHGPLSDAFTWNAEQVGKPAEGSPVAAQLARFGRLPETQEAGVAPGILEATWRYAAQVEGPGAGWKEMLGNAADPDMAQPFTRLHLLNAAGLPVMHARAMCKKWGYDYTHFMAQRQGDQPQQSVFVAIVEPYVGEPFITGRRLLAVTGSAEDARQAVAVEVTTANGHVDRMIAALPGTQVHEVPAAEISTDAEWAVCSTDAAGLRLASLTGGTVLSHPLVRLELGQAQREAKIAAVDYLHRQFRVDRSWPARTNEHIVETGVPGHWTSYTVSTVKPDKSQSAFQLLLGADYLRSQVTDVDTKEQVLTLALEPILNNISSNRRHWAASDDKAERFWRADYIGDRRWKLRDGPTVDTATFRDSPVLRVWEYGAGDTVRQRTSASLRRIDEKAFALTADVAVILQITGRRLRWSADGKTWSEPAEKITLSDAEVIDRTVTVELQ